MNRHRLVSLVILAVLALAAGASAQEPGVSIAFPFSAAGRVMDAGMYTVATTAGGNVVLTPQKGGAAVELPPIKTISRRNVERPELMFQLVGSVWFLSEVRLPDKGAIVVGKVDDAQEWKVVKGSKAK
jgi:hypothetical protein